MRVSAKWVAFAALVTAGCAEMIGIPDRALRFCLQPAEKHDFCEDFDHSGITSDWTAAPDPPPGASRTFVATDHAPPNALSMDAVVSPLATGESNFTGLQQVFTTRTFDHVILGADVRIDRFGYKADANGVATGAGFLLLSNTSSSSDQPSLCIGLALAPGTNPESVLIVIELVPNSHDCVTVDETQTDAGASAPSGDAADDAGDDGGQGNPSQAGSQTTPSLSPVALVFLKQWFRLTLDVKRQPDGSGAMAFKVTDGSSFGAPQIPPGQLGVGYPGIGIATDVTGPSDTVEVLFDNVTVDFP